MSHHQQHQHTTPFPPTSAAGRLPGLKFGALVGTYDHWTLAAHDGTRKNPNHVYVWVKVDTGEFMGKFEAAINVHSNDPLKPGQSQSDGNLSYHLHDEPLAEADWPAEGFSPAQVSFAGMGLKESDFTTVQSGELRQLVESWVTGCQLISVHGITYKEGDGIDQVHMNSGNPPARANENRPNSDGALVCLFDAAHGGPVARWLFLKFRTQKFPGS